MKHTKYQQEINIDLEPRFKQIHHVIDVFLMHSLGIHEIFGNFTIEFITKLRSCGTSKNEIEVFSKRSHCS